MLGKSMPRGPGLQTATGRDALPKTASASSHSEPGGHSQSPMQPVVVPVASFCVAASHANKQVLPGDT